MKRHTLLQRSSMCCVAPRDCSFGAQFPFTGLVEWATGVIGDTRAAWLLRTDSSVFTACLDLSTVRVDDNAPVVTVLYIPPWSQQLTSAKVVTADTTPSDLAELAICLRVVRPAQNEPSCD